MYEPDDEALEIRRAAFATGDTARLLDYVQVVFGREWFDEENRAAEAIERIAETVDRVAVSDPVGSRAALLYAHAALHVRMDDASVDRARELLLGVPHESEDWPAAALQLVGVNEWHGVERSDKEYTFRLVSESVERAPGLVHNNARLGRLHASRGDIDEARRYLEHARANILGESERRALSLVERSYHECFTGCLASPLGIDMDLTQLV
ncbi:hypothetical protein ACGFMM_34225 [Streptomyces sp. NPDC048604]|uniref:hypothetical protein n=1 Tax=Streptomyces sp. NPDC048604 TaxID=3365578 RepID=UPI003722DDAC